MGFTSKLTLEGASLREVSEGLWELPGHSGLNYVDGSEERLYRVIRESADISSTSTELARKCWNKVAKYHLSQRRANLLRPLNLCPDHMILELGAGCGALTRYLGEQGATVVAVEGALPRARVIRERCRDLSNVSVIASNFQALPQQRIADIVTLIGVLEYSAKYLTSPQPFLDCIRMAAGFARMDGVLIIAIENRLGLKYLCGESEDHYRRSMFQGIYNYPDFKGVRTFSRPELEDLIRAAGLEHLEFLFPFPDYKLPNSIITERGLKALPLKLAFRPSMVVCPERRKGLKASSNEVLPVGQLWQAMESAGSLPHFSNSFLVLASNDPNNLRALIRDGLAFYYPGRAKIAQAFLRETRFFEEDGEVKVLKKQLCEVEPEWEHPVYCKHFSDEVQTVSGESVDLHLRKALYDSNLDGVKAALRRYCSSLKDLGSEGEAGNNWLERKIHGKYGDFNTGNCILRKDGSYYAIDLEWYSKPGVRTWEILYRSLYHVTVNYFLPLAGFMRKRTRNEVFCGLLQMVDVPFEKQKFEEMLVNDIGFLHFVDGDAALLSEKEISEKLRKKLRSFHKKRRVRCGLANNVVVRQQKMLKGFVGFLARLRYGK